MSDISDNTAKADTTDSNTVDLNKPSLGWMTPELVKDYLLANPEFFARYPLLSEELKIPHQKKGSVSLVELQSEQLREKVAELQARLTELMSVARQNEAIYRIYADLNLKLFHCRSLTDIKSALEESVCEALRLSDVALHLFSSSGHLSQELTMSEQDRQTIVEKRLRKSDFFFGRLNQDENPLLFKNSEPKSVVIMRLKHEKEIGLLAIGSEDEGHFYPGMDTLLITQLQQFLSLLIPQVQG